MMQKPVPSLSVLFIIIILSHNGSTMNQQTTASRRSNIEVKLNVDTEIIEPIQQMYRAGQIKEIPEKSTIETIRKRFRLISEKLEKEVSSVSKADSGYKNMEKISNGITGIMESIPTLIKGIKNDDSRTVLTGAVGISSRISELITIATPPKELIEMSLKFISAVFSLFDGSTAMPANVREKMFELVDGNSISESKMNELKDEIMREFSIFQKMSDSLQALRSGMDEKRTKIESILREIAVYREGLQDVTFLGKLKESIEEYCKAGTLKYSGNDQDEQNKKVVKDANTCSAFIRLYVQLSILKQFVLTDIAATVFDAGVERTNSKRNSNDENLKQTALNFLNMISKEQKHDLELLRFLITPVAYPGHGFAVYQFYDLPNKNGLAVSYLNSLCSVFQDLCPIGITACTKHFLEGRCITIAPGTDLKLKGKYTSYIIPPRTKVREYTFHTVGPSAQAYLIYPSSTFDVEAISTVEEKKTQYMRLCYPWREIINNGPKTHQCRRFPEQASVPSFSGDSGSDLEAVSIPHGYYAVFVYEDEPTKEYAFYGPDDISVFCRKNRIDSIKLIKDKNSTKTVQICSGENFKGTCYKIPIKNENGQRAIMVINKENTGGCNIDAPRSIALPKGVEVTCYTDNPKEEGSYGPIIGPASLSFIDLSEKGKGKSSNEEVKIRMLKMVDTFTQIEMCEEEKLYGECYLYPILDSDSTVLTGKQEAEYPTDFQPKSARIPSGVEAEFETGTTVKGPQIIGRFENPIVDSSFTFTVVVA